MRKILTISVLFTALWMFHPSSPSAEEITKQDLLQMENRLKEYIDLRISAVNAEFKSVRTEFKAEFKDVNTRIDEMDKRIGLLQWMVGAVLVIVVTVLGIPQFVTLRRESRHSEERDQQIKDIAEFRHRLDQMEQKLSNLAK